MFVGVDFIFFESRALLADFAKDLEDVEEEECVKGRVWVKDWIGRRKTNFIFLPKTFLS